MTNNNLTNCRDCGKEVSKNADSCPHCGTQMYAHDKMKFQHIYNIGLLPIVAGLFFLFATMMISAEKGGVNLIFWTTFFTLTAVFYMHKKTIVKRAKDANWKYKDNSTTLGTILLYFPTWTIYVWSFIAPLGVHSQYNGFLVEVDQGGIFFGVLLFWLIGYRFFLKYFKLI